MASSAAAADVPIKQPDALSCLNDPNFAIICAFLQKFAGKLNITYPNFRELQQMLENTDECECSVSRIGNAERRFVEVCVHV